ncbi:uncharacterized protein MONBRDRAFT_32524 [Monosiga brevicollis MX1]|uniref:RNA cytidine acetyltransferase n=1 Tax=Monosiga brevicollis TaxID=81824 RepID=A9V035_MONBE|nr:uncharacterized protein MONBRDRAFT_32524 [Monosiga brevicollis MX1]EDQ88941.1 predicted protein [Monosiga brevicollis MX1]|eukprot:XP_001746046.1 hypothetical protein [Monosiga brevicollis MX1]
MVKKKVDSRVRTLIENGVHNGHRSMFVLVGDNGRDQVVNLHHMLSKASIKARPSVLWCYKKELGFTTHKKKRMQELKKKIKSGLIDPDRGDPFDLFIASTDIRYCYYSDTHKILGSTYGMLVLQDFEAVTPNLLARTIETVEGGGVVVLLLRSVKSLQQLYTMTMDVHSRYRTEAHQHVVPRFNERFLLSLKAMPTCLMLDDQLDIIPWARQTLRIEPAPRHEESVDPNETELKELKQSLADTQPAGSLVARARTLDQAAALLKFVEAISEKTLRSTLTLTAARGRGKSATLGLSIAAAIAYGYSNIFVTSPTPENLKTVFEFVFKGFDALNYQEHADYEIVQSTNPDFNKAIVRVNVFTKEHRQTIQYIQPQDAVKLGQAELVVIDEAAAIPLPLVKELIGPYLVFMASTVNGYEGTGRSLSLKLINQLRKESAPAARDNSASSRHLRELTLDIPIRYRANDPVEKWLNGLLCLDATLGDATTTASPHPSKCDLYSVERDALFSYNKVSELFLQRLMALYVASHYKNTPNDLQMLSDAPAHRIFCLLGPINPKAGALPEILCVVQVALEGEISAESLRASLQQGVSQSGDLIPWTLSQQYQDNDFGKLSGARIVRIATHPDYQGMGYGRRAIDQLRAFYNGEIQSLDEAPQAAPQREREEMRELAPRTTLPPLLLKLNEVPPERLDYLGVSFGATPELYKFWKKCEFAPVYLRQTQNNLTGEHTCIMLSPLNTAAAAPEWLAEFWKDFQRRFTALLPSAFKNLAPVLALGILEPSGPVKDQRQGGILSATELLMYFSTYDLKRLTAYTNNLVDYHVILDLLPKLAQLYFAGRLDVSLTALQKVILLCLGLQAKSVEDIERELAGPTASHIMGLFSQMMRRWVKHITDCVSPAGLERYAISMDDDAFRKAVQGKRGSTVSVKRTAGAASAQGKGGHDESASGDAGVRAKKSKNGKSPGSAKKKHGGKAHRK